MAMTPPSGVAEASTLDRAAAGDPSVSAGSPRYYVFGVFSILGGSSMPGGALVKKLGYMHRSGRVADIARRCCAW